MFLLQEYEMPTSSTWLSHSKWFTRKVELIQYPLQRYKQETGGIQSVHKCNTCKQHYYQLAFLPALHAGVMHAYMGIKQYIHEMSFLKSMRLPQLAM